MKNKEGGSYMDYKQHTIKLALNPKFKSTIETDLVAWSHDKNSYKFYFELSNTCGEPMILDGVVGRIKLDFLREGKTIIESLDIESEHLGLASFTIPDGVLGYEGKVEAHVYLDYESQTHDLGNFSFLMKKSSIDNKLPDLEFYVSEWDEAMEQWKKVQKEVKEITDGMQKEIDDTKKQIKDNNIITANTFEEHKKEFVKSQKDIENQREDINKNRVEINELDVKILKENTLSNNVKVKTIIYKGSQVVIVDTNEKKMNRGLIKDTPYNKNENLKNISEIFKEKKVPIISNASTFETVGEKTNMFGYVINDYELKEPGNFKEPPSKRHYLLVDADENWTFVDSDASSSDLLKFKPRFSLMGFNGLLKDYEKIGGISHKTLNPNIAICRDSRNNYHYVYARGRVNGNKGLSQVDMQELVLYLKYKDAYLLDGGGSSSLSVNGITISDKLENGGTTSRPIPDFLYFGNADEKEGIKLDVLNNASSIGIVNDKVDYLLKGRTSHIFLPKYDEGFTSVDNVRDSIVALNFGNYFIFTGKVSLAKKDTSYIGETGWIKHCSFPDLADFIKENKLVQPDGNDYLLKIRGGAMKTGGLPATFQFLQSNGDVYFSSNEDTAWFDAHLNFILFKKNY